MSQGTLWYASDHAELAQIQGSWPTSAISDDTETRCGKPGAWRNRSQRCEYGYEHGDPRIACPMHDKTRFELGALRERSECSRRAVKGSTREVVLKALRDSATPMNLSQIARASGKKPNKIAPCVRSLSLLHLISGHVDYSITDEGRKLIADADGVALLGKLSSGARGFNRERSSDDGGNT